MQDYETLAEIIEAKVDAFMDGDQEAYREADDAEDDFLEAATEVGDFDYDRWEG